MISSTRGFCEAKSTQGAFGNFFVPPRLELNMRNTYGGFFLNACRFVLNRSFILRNTKSTPWKSEPRSGSKPASFGDHFSNGHLPGLDQLPQCAHSFHDFPVRKF